MTHFGRALYASVAVCFGELVVMLLCFPLGAVGILPDGRYGIEVPPMLLIVAAPVIWLTTFVWLTVADLEPW